MSSLPGYRLEDFLAWNYDLIVDGDGSTNPSLQIAEALGNISPRSNIDKGRFRALVELFEEYREGVEYKLADFNEKPRSWRDYAYYAFDFIPENVFDEGAAFLKGGKL